MSPDLAFLRRPPAIAGDISALKMFLQKAWRLTAFGIYGFINFTRPGFQDHSNKFRLEDMDVRLDGKNCVVTGANSGIGYALPSVWVRVVQMYIWCVVVLREENLHALKSVQQLVTIMCYWRFVIFLP